MTVCASNFIWFNGKVLPWSDAKVHVMSHSLHYGSSVFEGLRCYDSYKGSVIFRHREHINRLMDSAKIYRMPVVYTIDELMEANKIIIKKNNLINAYIRPLIFIGDVGMDITPPVDFTTDVVVAAFSWGAYLGEGALDNGVDVMVSSWRRVAADTIPTISKAGGNYLSSMLIAGEARRHGYNEGIALDVHGYVSEGSGENLFVVKNNILFTPPCSSSILPGITRDSIIILAKYIGIEVKEQVLSREFLYLADEVFISGTAAEITPVCSVDGIDIGVAKNRIITRKLQKIFFGMFTGDTKDMWNWLDVVYD